MSDILNAEQKLVRAIIKLRNAMPFYCCVLESLGKVEVNDTNAKKLELTEDKLMYMPSYIESLSDGELNYELMHISTHAALKHVSRRGDADLAKWNMAADLFTDAMLYHDISKLARGFGKFEAYGDSVEINGVNLDFPFRFVDKSIDLDKESVESIYNNMAKKQSQSDNMEMLLGGSDDLSSGDNNRELSQQLANQLVAMATTKYEMDKAKYGDKLFNLQESSLYELVTRGDAPEFNWERYVARYCVKCRDTDTSYSNPDDRMYYQNIIYPGYDSDGSSQLKGIKLCIDISGSVSTEEIRYVLGLTNKIFKRYETSAELILWDVTVESKGIFDNIKKIAEIEISGRGGTDANCVFEYVSSKECNVKPVLIIMFTDGYLGSEVNSWKRYKDTLWVMSENCNKKFNPGFGKIAYPDYSKLPGRQVDHYQ